MLSFTFKKFLSSRKNRILLILLMIALGSLMIYYETSVSQLFYTTQKQQLVLQVQQAKQNVQQLTKDMPQSIQQSVRENLTRMEQQQKAWNSRDFNRFNKLANEANLELITQYERDPSSVSGSINDVRESIAYYEAVLKSGQNFTLGQGFDDTAFGALSNYTTAWLSSIVFFVLFSLLCGDYFCNEFQNGLRFYHLLKVSKKKVLLNYLVIPVCVGLAAVALFFAFSFVVIGFWKGWGSPMFPFGEPSFVTTPIWQIGLWAVGYLLFSLLFLTSLGQLLALFVKRTYLSASILVIVLVGFYAIKDQTFMQPLLKWIPLTYLGSGQVIHYYSFLFGDSSLAIGLGILAVCSLIFFGLSNVLFEHYTYRKG